MYFTTNEMNLGIFLRLSGIVVYVLRTVTFDLCFRMLGAGASLSDSETFYETFYCVFCSSI